MAENYNFLFWNVNQNYKNKNINNIIQAIVDIVDKKKINFVLLAETKLMDSSLLLTSLKAVNKNFKYRGKHEILLEKRFMAFDTLNTKVHQDTDTDKRITSFIYNINKVKVILNLVHLRDKYNYDTYSLNEYAKDHVGYIYEIERKEKSDNSIVVGDFNLDPYEHGIMGVKGFNAIMCSKTVENKGKRTFGKYDYNYFYNPSWELIGKSNSTGTLGTYFFNDSGKVDLALWHVLDQVLIRQGLLKHYKPNSLEIIKEIPSLHKFINRNGKPNATKYSDHLPLIFTLEF
ncbi:endonuclease/exonuclease/phosphatase family protein [Peribacillus frigoritolerans]|uniref:endonuclease/exonuclease/phosphatase family protein n=1 Tax=Peribacillus frigoritolerans TaxID=450367 RepID=UPI00215B5776|nr:endonuclease/exonuclease/phosphatase family protein [Peribacillus frigoritolerans]MCR8867468.1 endonuclease/exonuclease/phosphatase family protein [Peribacillus frigoritolerans]